jgi:hypothetical protein
MNGCSPAGKCEVIFSNVTRAEWIGGWGFGRGLGKSPSCTVPYYPVKFGWVLPREILRVSCRKILYCPAFWGYCPENREREGMGLGTWRGVAGKRFKNSRSDFNLKIADRFHHENRSPIFPERFLIGITIAFSYVRVAGEMAFPRYRQNASSSSG